MNTGQLLAMSFFIIVLAVGAGYCVGSFYCFLLSHEPRESGRVTQQDWTLSGCFYPHNSTHIRLGLVNYTYAYLREALFFPDVDLYLFAHNSTHLILLKKGEPEYVEAFSYGGPV